MRESNQLFTHDKLQSLVSEIAASASTVKNSDEWIDNTQSLINTWAINLPH